MLRSFFIAMSKAKWAQYLITHLGIAKRAAGRFIAGMTVEEAITAVKQLNANGMNATLDHLGENTNSIEEARRATDDVLVILDEIQKSGVRSNVSIKLTQLGLALDANLCHDHLRMILERAKSYDNFIRIDMEDGTLTEATLEMLNRVRGEGFDQVGIVIQSYLYRSEADVKRLLTEGVAVRLVKGAYQEPESLAYPKKEDVDASFDRITDYLIEGSVGLGGRTVSKDGRVPPVTAIASHDEARIAHARQAAERAGLPKQALEFQMLYGIRRDLQEQLTREGYPVRIYVPYGSHWYPYFMRRLAERPANVWFFMSNYFKK